MKIVDVQTYLVGSVWMNWLFVKVTTDTGLYGWGEATIEGQVKSVQEAVKILFERSVCGEDPVNVEKIWRKMYHHGFWKGGFTYMSAVSGIDMAIWDILGKHFKVPTYQLLGGAVRDKIKTYTHANDPETAATWVEAGFAGIKTVGGTWGPGYDGCRCAEAVDERLSSISKVIGKRHLMVDNHGQSTAAVAIQQLEVSKKYNLYFYEEPIPPENSAEYKRVRTSSYGIPLAAGERLYSRFDSRELIENQLVDFIQPDICHCGGISEIRRIASYAEVYHIKYAPHNPNGPVAAAANLHVAAATQNFDILEFAPKSLYPREEIYNLRFKPVDGYFKVPEGNGLGIELDETKFLKYPYQNFQYDTRYCIEGSVSEI